MLLRYLDNGVRCAAVYEQMKEGPSIGNDQWAFVLYFEASDELRCLERFAPQCGAF